ncbi:hypothetical protein [Propionivibrio limicola]|uniref:hypothetical protein n=1 Tax=Propionivibrio limicola TaxID=167645 RepID=UPI001290DBA7|nr:hypothetical protein [Propionivibrio limicola]
MKKPIFNAPAPLALDFSPTRRRPGWLGWLALVVGAAALGGVLGEAYSTHVDLQERASIVERLRAQLSAKGGRTATGSYEAGPAFAVAAQLNADWAGMFADLARAQESEFNLVELQADAARGSVRIVAEVPTLEAAFAYLERLRAQRVLRSATLDSHALVDAGGRMVVRFTASAHWGAER